MEDDFLVAKMRADYEAIEALINKLDKESEAETFAGLLMLFAVRELATQDYEAEIEEAHPGITFSDYLDYIESDRGRDLREEYITWMTIEPTNAEKLHRGVDFATEHFFKRLPEKLHFAMSRLRAEAVYFGMKATVEERGGMWNLPEVMEKLMKEGDWWRVDGILNKPDLSILLARYNRLVGLYAEVKRHHDAEKDRYYAGRNNPDREKWREFWSAYSRRMYEEREGVDARLLTELSRPGDPTAEQVVKEHLATQYGWSISYLNKKLTQARKEARARSKPTDRRPSAG